MAVLLCPFVSRKDLPHRFSIFENVTSSQINPILPYLTHFFKKGETPKSYITGLCEKF